MHFASAIMLSILGTLAMGEDATVLKGGECDQNKLYCGHSLHKMGWSYDTIYKQTKGNKPPRDAMENSLYKCRERVGKDNIDWDDGKCGKMKCVDAPKGNDYCARK